MAFNASFETPRSIRSIRSSMIVQNIRLEDRHFFIQSEIKNNTFTYNVTKYYPIKQCINTLFFLQ